MHPIIHLVATFTCKDIEELFVEGIEVDNNNEPTQENEATCYEELGKVGIKKVSKDCPRVLGNFTNSGKWR